jgi:hypothetical protein
MDWQSGARIQGLEGLDASSTGALGNSADRLDVGRGCATSCPSPTTTMQPNLHILGTDPFERPALHRHHRSLADTSCDARRPLPNTQLTAVRLPVPSSESTVVRDPVFFRSGSRSGRGRKNAHNQGDGEKH